MNLRRAPNIRRDPNLRRAVQAGTAALALAALCGCGQAAGPGSGSGSGNEPVGATTTAPSVGTVVAQHEDVEFYPACGNEVLWHEGTKWYPLPRDDHERLDRDHEVGATAAGTPHTSPVVVLASARPLPAVAEPGPGDDIGTVTVYDDGLARFESDSGDLVAWLTTEPRTYNWDC